METQQVSRLEPTPIHGVLPDLVRDQIGATVLRLAHQSTVVQGGFMESPTYEIMSTDGQSQEQAEANSKVSELMGHVGQYLAKAHESTVKIESISCDDQYGQNPEFDIYGVAKAAARDDALRAHEQGDDIKATLAIESMFAISMLGKTDDSNGEIRQLVSAGMAEQVVDAAQDMHGVIALPDGFGDVRSALAQYYGEVDLLQVATKCTFDDQIQHKQPLDGLAEIDRSDALGRLEKKLSPQDHVTLAALEANVRHDPDEALRNTVAAGEKILSGVYDYGQILPTDVARIITIGAECASKTHDEGMQTRYHNMTDKMRARRSAGQKPGYRQNDPLFMAFDGALVHMAAEGNRKGVMALVSSSSKEADNIGWPIKFLNFSEQAATVSRKLVEECSADKRALLQETLAKNGAPDWVFKTSVDTVHDPDGMGRISEDFWNLYSTTSNPQVDEMLFGENAFNQPKVTSIMVGLVASGIEYDAITRNVVSNMTDLNPEQTHSYLQQVSSLMRVVKGAASGQQEEHVLDQRHLEAILGFREPCDLFMYARKLYGKDAASKATGLGVLLQGDKNWGGVTTVSLDTELRNNLDYALDKGLNVLTEGQSELIQDQLIRFSIRGPVTDDQKPFEVLSDLVAGGLFSFAVSQSELVTKSILNARQPHDQLATVKKLEDLGMFEIIKPDGPLGLMGDRFLTLILEAHDPFKTYRDVKSILSGGQKSLWWLNYQYANLLLGEVENGAVTGYAVSALPIGLPMQNQSGHLPKDIKLLVPFETMESDEKLKWLTPEAVNQGYLNQRSVPFSLLTPDARSTALGYRLYESIAKSRSENDMSMASARNNELMQLGEPFRHGDLVHATNSVMNFRNILTNGILCGETIGMASRRDSYPYNVDAVEISDVVMQGQTFEEKVRALKNSTYGPILLVSHRDATTTDFGNETRGGMNEDHRLIFGAIPSTEVSAIILRDADEKVKTETVLSVIEHGVYAPVYDTDGTLLLTYDDFVYQREDGNYNAVNPQIVDSSFKLEGTQAGSNEGSWYIVQTANGQERWYVKYGDASIEKSNHLWTEILADNLYRAVIPEVTTETRAVLIDGRLARASKAVNLDDTLSVTNEARNEGFVMDCLLGNWDAVYNSANLVMSNEGHAMRIDTGNGLDYRARGDRKDEGVFGEIVQEVEFGSNKEGLGSGMRQMYPDLTDEEITRQVNILRDRLSDEKIDNLVNSIRRPKADRAQLAHTLKARRQYLIQHFLS